MDDDQLRQLRVMAETRLGPERARELDTRLMDLARWLALIEEPPLDLLDEEPDGGY